METQQIYRCLHCGKFSETVFTLVLHVFTEHLHKDIVLEPWQCQDLLRRMVPQYKLVYWWN